MIHHPFQINSKVGEMSAMFCFFHWSSTLLTLEKIIPDFADKPVRLYPCSAIPEFIVIYLIKNCQMLRGRLSLMSIFLSLLWIKSWLAWIILSKRATNLQPMLSCWQNYFSICEVWEMQVEAISWNCRKVACCFLERHNLSKLHLISFDKASVSSCPPPPPP